MNNPSDDYDLIHPLDDLAHLRQEAVTTLTDVAADLNLGFTIEDDTMTISLPPRQLEELDVGPE